MLMSNAPQVMPLICDGGFYGCTTTTNNRWRLRKNLTDCKCRSSRLMSLY
jgi:hypothetical protein